MTNPQTCISRYYKSHVLRYQKICLPNLSSPEKLASVITDDLCQLYAGGYKNTVIYMQGANDFFHIYNHMIPFLSACESSGVQRLLVFCNYWGKMGHSGSVTPDAYMLWLGTLLLSPSLKISDLYQTYAKLQPATLGSNDARTSVDQIPAALGNDRLALADILRDYHLRQPVND